LPCKGRVLHHSPGMSVNEVQILPDPEQHEVLVATLERVNRVSNAARAAALARPGGTAGDLRDIVSEEIEKAKLPGGFHAPIVDRVQAALDRRLKKFSTYQSVTLPASAFKWSSDGRVALPTAKGRRTIRVRIDMTRGGLRPPLEGRPTSIVYSNGQFELWAADVDRRED
jgi:hypothetical protein